MPVSVLRNRVPHAREATENLVDAASRARHRTAERIGGLAGSLVSPLFRAARTWRRKHALPPRGDCAEAQVTVADDVAPNLRALAERLCGDALVRFSDAHITSRARWPDVLGCAIRFGLHSNGGDDVHDGVQDLLLATVKRPWTAPLSSLTTHAHDYLANDYFGVSPYSIASISAASSTRRRQRQLFYFRLRPAAKEPGALVTIESYSVPASPEGSSGSLERATRRRRRLERAIANGSASFTLGIASGPRGPFAPLVRIHLVAIRHTDRLSVHFDPFRCGLGIEPYGFVQSLRRRVYEATRTAREREREP